MRVAAEAKDKSHTGCVPRAAHTRARQRNVGTIYIRMLFLTADVFKEIPFKACIWLKRRGLSLVNVTTQVFRNHSTWVDSDSVTRIEGQKPARVAPY